MFNTITRSNAILKLDLKLFTPAFCFKVGVHPILSEILIERFKEGIEERKLFLKHQQTVDPHARAPQVVRGLFGCPHTNF